MAERRLIFPDDHLYHPGKTLVIPDGTSQEDLDAQIEELSKPPQEPQSNYPATIASAVPKAITNTLGSAASGAAYLGGLESPNTAMTAGKVSREVSKRMGAPKSLGEGLARINPFDTEQGPFSQKRADISKGVTDEFEKKGQGLPDMPNPGFLTDMATKTLGLHTPQTPGEKIVDSAVQMGVGGLLGGGVGGGLARTGVYGLLPGALSEYARQKTEGLKVPGSVPLIGGKDISPAVSMATAMFAPVPARGLLTAKGKIDPIRRQQYDAAVRESGGKFTPTAGQLRNDPAQINKELYARPDINQQQSNAIMETATEPSGASTRNITYGKPGDWVDANLARTGRNLDNLEGTTHIQHPTGNVWAGSGVSSKLAYPEFGNVAMKRPMDVPGILKVIEQTTGKVPSSTAFPGEEIHNALFNSNGTGRLTGEQYRRLHTNLHTAAETAGSPEAAHSYRQTANALDGAMSATNPAWGQAWQQGRREYANTLVFRDLAANAKKGRTQFTPDEISSASRRVMGKVPWVRGSLENAPFISSAAAFQPLKRTKVPEEPGMMNKVASYIPGGQKALASGKLLGATVGGLAGAKIAQHLGAEPMQIAELAGTSGILGSILGERARGMPNLTPYAMNPYSQWRGKNQLLPKPSMSEGSAAAAIRALFNAQNQNNQESKNK